MRIYKTALCAISVLAALTGCKEEEVQSFSGEAGVNFMAPDGNGGFYDSSTSYQSLSSVCDFYGYYQSKGTMDVDYVDVPVCLQLEGRLSDKPLSIRLKAETEDGYEMPELEMPGDSVMEADTYQRVFNIKVKRPAVYDTEYRAVIKVDYDNSDVVAGTMERQQYEIVVKDETNWEDMQISSTDEAGRIEEWNYYFGSTLGSYGPVKVRFIQAALGAAGYSSGSISYKYLYHAYGYPSYGFNATIMGILNDALAEYNATHVSPLAEADGTAVTFN